VARIVYTENALDNLERIFHFLVEREPAAAAAAAAVIRRTVALLTEHPLIGHRVQGELRELVISYGKTGYVALYRFLPERDLVRVLAIRHQRELDYPG
jgi:plasmid stabilization system protein ParE